MKMHRITLLLAMFCLSIACHAQFGWGFKAGLGLSQLSGYLKDPFVKMRVYPSPSCAVGPYAEFHFGKHLSVESDLLFSLITDHFRTDQPYTLSGANGYYSMHYYRQIGFLSLPLMLGVKVKSFQFYGGLQGSTYLFGRYRENANNNSPLPSFENSGDLSWMDRFDYGPKVAATWNFHDHWSAEASFYQGLPDLLPYNNPNQSWYSRQLLVGLRYRIR